MMDFACTPKSINNIRQNKVKYVISDLMDAFNLHPGDEEIIRQILLRRGINKWLTCRRMIIRLKDEWKSEITMLQDEMSCTSGGDKSRLRGHLKALVGARQDLRKICHLSRWQFPK